MSTWTTIRVRRANFDEIARRASLEGRSAANMLDAILLGALGPQDPQPIPGQSTVLEETPAPGDVSRPSRRRAAAERQPASPRARGCPECAGAMRPTDDGTGGYCPDCGYKDAP